MYIYFLRHGETTASQTGSYCGALDVDLSPAGYQMAKEFAETYKNLPWAAVFASPLQRTIETARPLCEMTKIQMQLDEGLRELAYGKWEGKTPEKVSKEFHDDYIRWLADPGWNPPTGGEKGADVAWRSSDAIEKIRRKYSEGNVLVVSHKATIRIMLCSLLGVDVGRFRDRFNLPVASLSIVEMAVHGPLLHVFGDRSHLGQDIRRRPGT